MNAPPNQITKQVIGAAIEVHRIVGLRIDFNVPVLKDGIRRRVLNLAE